LTPDAVYAVRCNENYIDVKAALENERSYVRAAALKANIITMYRCIAKHPVMILAGFSANDIKEATTRSIEAAVNRATVLRPATGNRMMDIGGVNGYDPLFRMTGPDDVIAAFAARALPTQHFHTKKYHVDGCSVAHAYMSAEEVQEARKHVLIEEVGNIVSSRKASQQLTLRDNNLNPASLLRLGLKLQDAGAGVYMRTYGTLRVTLTETVTAATHTWLKTLLPTMHNTVAMGALVKFTQDAWLSVVAAVAEPFTVADALWQMTPLRRNTSKQKQ
jgi:hypothetical protein